MYKQLFFIGITFLLFSCSATKSTTKDVKQKITDRGTFVITEIAVDKTYGLTPENPVEVGGVKNSEGPINERRYLNALAGPNGEPISYFRAGSCCPIKSENAIIGDRVLLDNYRVTWEDSEDTVSIFINMYDSGHLKAPVGFTIMK